MYRKTVCKLFKVEEWHYGSGAEQRPYSICTYNLINGMKPLGKVVEVGCGLGDILSKIETKNKVGYDINPNVIKASKIIHPKLKTCVGSFDDIRNEEIDILYCVDVLHILPDNDFRKKYEELIEENKIENIIVDFVPSPPYQNSHDYIPFFAENGYSLAYESRPFAAYGTAKRRIMLFKKGIN